MTYDFPPLAFVRERATDERPSDPYHCPMCHHTGRNRGFDRTTLVGGGDGTWNGDVNHTWADNRTCRACGARWHRETKSGKVWYTDDDGVVLRGFPNCYESYVYHCARCDHGRVTREYRTPDGQPARFISYAMAGSGEVRPQQTVHWTCTHCGELREDA